MLVAELREHALVIGEVTLTSGRTAQYYVDAKRAILRPEGFAALATLLAAESARRGATAVGGMTMGADAVVCAALAGGAKASGFFVRKEAKAHGLQRRIEGPPLAGHGALPGGRGRGHDGRLDARRDRRAEGGRHDDLRRGERARPPRRGGIRRSKPRRAPPTSR